jgi:nucleoside recognition membrane protein YjiH
MNQKIYFKDFLKYLLKFFIYSFISCFGGYIFFQIKKYDFDIKIYIESLTKPDYIVMIIYIFTILLFSIILSLHFTFKKKRK